MRDKAHLPRTIGLSVSVRLVSSKLQRVEYSSDGGPLDQRRGNAVIKTGSTKSWGVRTLRLQSVLEEKTA